MVGNEGIPLLVRLNEEIEHTLQGVRQWTTHSQDIKRLNEEKTES